MKNKYSILDVYEAMERSKQDNWHNDEWASDVVNAAVTLGWANRASVTQCEWTDEGVEEYRKAIYNPLVNGYTAVYEGETDFGNRYYTIYPIKIECKADIAARKGMHISPMKYIMVDNVLHSSTRDLEPECPLKASYQFQDRETIASLLNDEESLTGENVSLTQK